jgi:FtsH-binding integral membrane protein
MADFQRELQKLLKFDNLEKPVQAHLKKVYSSLAICMLVAAVGGYVHLFTNIMQAGLLTIVGSIGLLIMLGVTPHTPENEGKRFGCLIGFSFFSGMALGPLLDVAIMVDPSIVPTAFLVTSAIFICFSLSALLSNQRQWIFLGGILFSGLSWLLILSLLNIFMQSQFLYDVNLYLGLVIMCGFILYDTQLIVEKRRRGDDDYIWHAVDLFIDFINLFRRILILLTNKESKRKNNRN